MSGPNCLSTSFRACSLARSEKSFRYVSLNVSSSCDSERTSPLAFLAMFRSISSSLDVKVPGFWIHQRQLNMFLYHAMRRIIAEQNQHAMLCEGTEIDESKLVSTGCLKPAQMAFGEWRPAQPAFNWWLE